MKEYREEHQEKDKKLYVFIWVRLNLRFFPADSGKAKAFGGPNPEHIIWKKATTGLVIDPSATDPSAAYNTMDLTMQQLEPEVRRPEAEAWIDTPAGIKWRGTSPVQLFQVSIDGH